MLKTKACLEITIEEKVFQLLCDHDAPLGSLHDALMQMKGWTVERMIAAHKQDTDAAEASAKVEPIPMTDHFQETTPPVEA